MHWNPLVPELNVRSLKASLPFYVDAIGFDVAFRRDDPPFVYLDLSGAQLMLEQDHDSQWVTGELTFPRGRGMNLQIEVPDVSTVHTRMAGIGVRAFREITENWYRTDSGLEGALECLVQDPDGYLIRLIQILEGPPPRAAAHNPGGSPR